MNVYRVVLKRTRVDTEYYVVTADDEQDALEIALEEEFYPEQVDSLEDTSEIVAVDEI
jgi:hypothetical protein